MSSRHGDSGLGLASHRILPGDNAFLPCNTGADRYSRAATGCTISLGSGLRPSQVVRQSRSQGRGATNGILTENGFEFRLLAIAGSLTCDEERLKLPVG